MRTNGTSERKILVIDDEPLHLDILSRALCLAFPKDQIVACGSGREALEVLDGIDLLITDLCMPDVDGFEVLIKAREKAPNLPTIVMSGFGFARAGELARTFGTRLFLEKPLDFDTLCHAIRSVLDSPKTVESVVRGFGLSSFLQLMDLDCKTGNLEILVPGRHGTMCFENGRLTYAVAGNRSGDEAVFEILTWPDPEIRVSNFVEAPAANVDTPLSSLLLEGCHALDEKDDAESLGEKSGEPATAERAAGD